MFTLVMIVAIVMSYRYENIIKYMMALASTRNALALFDFDDNRKNMDKPELLQFLFLIANSAFIC